MYLPFPLFWNRGIIYHDYPFLSPHCEFWHVRCRTDASFSYQEESYSKNCTQGASLTWVQFRWWDATLQAIPEWDETLGLSEGVYLVDCRNLISLWPEHGHQNMDRKELEVAIHPLRQLPLRSQVFAASPWICETYDALTGKEYNRNYTM